MLADAAVEVLTFRGAVRILLNLLNLFPFDKLGEEGGGGVNKFVLNLNNFCFNQRPRNYVITAPNQNVKLALQH